ncbi:indole-3-glycerol phosphate synthase TrpC [Hugenholtzia roseola]|uniref:indole-3-glycerol phosphate synthase TrpC n=1 Tax=Hugenholtzia roseola TaxID=1002 RepID=UPI00041F0271|nr:indole-3-glycerol phosphate synthase TrpC [Hugenholtzia roseola]
MLLEIVKNRYKIVEKQKMELPLSVIEKSEHFKRACFSLSEKITKSALNFQIIAEFKRKSPSKGLLNGEAQILPTVLGYEAAGACGVSILTENQYFMGKSEDIAQVRAALQLPILRKDFIVESYQIFESKALGADVILLIAACLDKKTIQEFTNIALDLGMEVLLELHQEQEIDKIPTHNRDSAILLGVNNRNLETMQVSLQNSFHLAETLHRKGLHQDKIWVSESGLSSPADLSALKQVGFDAFLMGERFMKDSLPAKALQDLLQV